MIITVRESEKPPAKSDAEQIAQARQSWKKQYEESHHAKFVEDICPTVASLPGDSVDLSCREKISVLVNGARETPKTIITYHLKRTDNGWIVESATFSK